MTDKAARSKQYEYRANSNLVLQPEREKNREHEPTGEPETLAGRLTGKFGDRAQVSGVDQEFKEKVQQARAKRAKKQAQQEEEKQGKKKKSKLDARDVLSVEQSSVGGYRPKTRETKAAWESLLSFVQECFGDQPQEVFRDAANEILAILKNDNLKAPEKKKDVEKIVGSISEAKFSEIMDIGRRITDYTDEVELGVEALDDEIGVAVVFGEEEEDEDEEEAIDEVRDEEDEDQDEEEGREGEATEIVHYGKDDNDMDIEEDPLNIDPKEIKAFWLKGKVSEIVDPDPLNSQKIAEDILKILEGSQDERECENNLVQLLQFQNFDFIKLLMRNRLKILYCTKLAHAEDDQQKQKIEAEMKEDPQLRIILDQLNEIGGKSKTYEEQLRKEARRIKVKDVEASSSSGKARNLLDLENLAFTQGSHFMSNKQCKLPPGSYRKQKKGYEEIHIPALKYPEDNFKFVEVATMPEWAQKAFPRIKQLNRIQSALYPAAFQSHENLLLCAPTGSGKTNVAMLCMLRELGVNMTSDGQIDLDNFKIIYIAPMKALVQEIVGNFSARLQPFGVSVKELTGDINLTKEQIKETQVIITTPEKWDIITRKNGDRTFTQMVKLIIIDEIHLLHDERGPVLESIVARTLRQIETTQENIRLVGLSATLPNYEDVATFLRVKSENLFAFNGTFRPCPLEQQFIGITEKKAMKRLNLMNEITYEKVMEHAGSNQILVFVHSRKETAKTAKALRDMALSNDTLSRFIKEGSASREILQTEADEHVKNADLKEILPYGFGIHHAGMARADRTLVEDLFADGHIQVLISTATLAWGVNLPAHAVIIKGTQIYSPEKGSWTELSHLDIMQMLGRAGRPGHDLFGVGVTITSHVELQYYLSLMNQQLPIESQFLSKLPDNLNAEIVLGSIQNIDEAVLWLGYTYLYICMLRSPTLYGVTLDEAEEDPRLLKRRQDLVHTAASILDKANLIKYDRKTGNFQVTDLGVVASHYYVTHGSMSSYNEQLKPNMGDIELFRLFSLSSEFKYITVRPEEKIELEKLIEKVPVPVKESIEEPTAKVNVLLQAFISRLKLDGFALMSDMVYVTQSAARLYRAIFEIVLKRGWASVAERALAICKMVDKRMWSSQCPLRQFKDIPEDIVKKIEKKDFPMERLYDLNAQELGELVNFPSQGKNLQKHIHMFPKLELTAHVQPITFAVLRIELTITPDFKWDEKIHGNAEPFWVIVKDVDGEKILHYEYFVLKKKFAEEEHTLSFIVPLFKPLHPQYFVSVISDKWIGSETTLPISFRHLFLPERFVPPTELLDLKPMLLSDLKQPAYEKLFSFKQFNPIQTQTFNALYHHDNSVLIAAPTGSGKTVCAELAVLHLFSTNPSGRCVYVAPSPALVKERMRDWSTKFGQKLDKIVVELTGETGHDLKLLEKGNVIISTPENWDLISRRWKQRKNVQNVALFIVDELHLIGGESGPTLEVIVSRMRHIASQTENKIRIVGLSASVANAKDLADWIGANSSNTFNFHPNTRPLPLEIHIQGFDIIHFGSRLLAMSRPMLYAVSHHGRGKPVIIFVPNRKQVRSTTRDLINYVDPEDPNRQFLHISEQDLEPILDQVQNKALKESLKYGIGLHHENISEKEKKIVEKLFSVGAVQVLIVTYNLCWEINYNSYLTIIMGTQYYDGKEHRYADYPLADILQMMGRSARPLQDELGKCVLFCFGPKKEFYKKFLYEPLPVESHLDRFLADHLNAEVVNKTIENKQDALNYLTWTFMYRRLTQNPNYYNLAGVSHRHLSDHLSELIEQTVADLEQSKCITVEDEMDISPLNLGMIACYYNIKYTSIELFSSSLNAKTKLKGLIEILSSASEFDQIPIRQGEEKQLRKVANHLPLKNEKPNFTNVHTKVNVLLQSHFSRRIIPSDLGADQAYVLDNSIRLLQSIVDVISSNSWLSPALAAMELTQMITQATWDNDSVLKQVPHFTEETLQRAKKMKIESVFDLMEMSDSDRSKLLQMSERETSDVAKFCNRYPNIELSFQVQDSDSITSGEQVEVTVQLEREMEEDEDLGPVVAPFFPKERIEGWWLVIGDPKTNQLVSIKRVTFTRKTKTKLDFQAPAAGIYNYTLYFMSDSFLGCDQEYELKLSVKPGEDAMEQ